MEDFYRSVKHPRTGIYWGTPAISSTSGVQKQNASICFTGATPATAGLFPNQPNGLSTAKTSTTDLLFDNPWTTASLGFSTKKKRTVPLVFKGKHGRRRNKPIAFGTITPTVEANSGNRGNSEKSDSELFQFGSRSDKSESFDFKFNTERSTEHSEVYEPSHVKVPEENTYVMLNNLIALGKKEKVIQFLKDKEITPKDYYNKVKSCCLMELKCVAVAARWGHTDIVNSLIDLGFDPDEKGYQALIPVRPIHLACQFGHLAVVQDLVENHGVKEEAKFGENSFLHHAQREVNKVIFKYLIEERNFSVNITDNEGKSLLHLAAKGDDEEFCKYLLDLGADPNISIDMGPTPLALAVRHVPVHIKIVRLLLSAGAKINVKTSEGDPVFLVAVRLNDYELTEILSSYGPDPDTPDAIGETPVYVVCKCSPQARIRFLRLLLCDMNASPDIPNEEGETALDILVEERNYSIIQLFVDTGYDTTTVTNRLKDLSEDAMKSEDAASLLAVLGRPRSLFELTCFKIRSVLGKTLPNAVKRLPVPKKVQGVLMLDYIQVEKYR